MTQELFNELQRTAERYKKYGITLPLLLILAARAPEGTSERAAVNGIRLSLAREYGETEYFTVDDVAEITGETAEEVRERMKVMGIDTTEITSLIPGLFS